MKKHDASSVETFAPHDINEPYSISKNEGDIVQVMNFENPSQEEDINPERRVTPLQQNQHAIMEEIPEDIVTEDLFQERYPSQKSQRGS